MRSIEKINYKKVQAKYAKGCIRNPCVFWGWTGPKSLMQFSAPYIYRTDIKYIFVGTITPPEGIERGFYYTSGYNRFWLWLDLCIPSCWTSKKSGPFSELKEKLANNYNSYKPKTKVKNTVANKFLQLLEKHHVAVCDVIKECVFTKDSSSDDNDIARIGIRFWCCELKNAIIKNPKVVLLANSDKAQEFLERCNFNYWCPQWDPKTQIKRMASPSGRAKLSWNPKGIDWVSLLKGNI
jgi:G:T/U-mismatch repair DNA glycosylase